MAVVSFFGYTFFPLSISGYAGTTQDRMHVLVTIFVVAFTIISLILFCIGFFSTGKYKYLGIISLCALILLAIGAILVNIVPKDYFGVAERINIYSVIIYTCILSIWMYKYINSENNQR
jgi:predicted tellurium resistance membrane protein TerC